MLPTLIQRYDQKSFHFKNERPTEILQLSGATFYNCIDTIHQIMKSFLDNKMSIFEEYGAFKVNGYTFRGGNSVKMVLSLF